MCGNVEREYTRDELEGQLKTEFISALQPAFGRLSALELRPNQIVTHNTELEDAMNAALSAKWSDFVEMHEEMMDSDTDAYVKQLSLVAKKLMGEWDDSICF